LNETYDIQNRVKCDHNGRRRKGKIRGQRNKYVYLNIKYSEYTIGVPGLPTYHLTPLYRPNARIKAVEPSH